MTDIKVYAISGIDYTAGQQTGYILAKGKDAVLIDASCSIAALQAVLEKTDARLHAILLTHCHFDHCANAVALGTFAPIYAHACAWTMLEDGDWTAGLPMDKTADWRPDIAVEDGQTLTFGSLNVRVIVTPGHSADSVCYLVDDEYLAAGDTVMNDIVCGATHFPTGDAELLYRSGQKLWGTCPPSVRILGGHVARYDRAEWALYNSSSTVGKARFRNWINKL